MFAPVYFDHNATTPMDSRVLEAMLPYLTQQYGNASSRHEYGRAARQAIGEGSGYGRHADIGDHLDRERSSQNRARVAPGKVVSEQAKRDRGKPRPYQRYDLCEKKMPVGPVRED